MLPQILNSTNIPALAQVIGFAQARHQVLAGNVANATTPGYRVRDLSVETFQQRLKALMEAKPGDAQPASPGRVRADSNDELRQVKESMTNILYHDDTNIDLEIQAKEMSKNQMLHNMAITIMTNQFALMQTAISERV